MQTSKITESRVEAFLKALRSGDKANVVLLKLNVLKLAEDVSDDERFILQADYLLEVVSAAYSASRKSENLPADLPTTRSEMMLQIGKDFSVGNTELEGWSVIFYRYFATIPLSVEEISSAANVVPQQYRRRLNLGIANLTALLQRAEIRFKKESPPVEKNLPLPDYTRLVGVQPYFDQLSALFNDPDGPEIVSIEGFGGIGKTALTRAFVSLEDTHKNWSRILWVSARQYFLNEAGNLLPFPEAISTLEDITTRLAEQLDLGSLAGKPTDERLESIRAALAAERTLIVIDNLETVSEYRALIPALAKCSSKDSRFLITTRFTLRELLYVHVLKLQELSEASSRALLEAELSRRGQTACIDPSDFLALYKVMGGIPLALKLVASQLAVQSVSQVLQGFAQVKTGTAEFYRYLYWQTWQSLSDAARELLLSFLPADPEGEDLKFIQQMSGLAEESFYKALRELDQFSLLETDGNIHAPHYRLHRLTITFLQTDLLKLWNAVSNDDSTHFNI